MEPHDDSGKWMFIAHAVCCGGPLVLILIAGNAAFLLSVVRSGAFWAGTALLLGSVAFFLIRRRRACQPRPPTLRPRSGQAADPSTLRQGSGPATLRTDGRPRPHALGARFHE
ncbi:MAG: hypothetical protein ACE5LU_20895 [Anaerolineae bacterium]